MNYRLQPLRIPAGWTVTLNSGLYEVDPTPKLIDEDDHLFLFKEDMLQLRHEQRDRVLDVGWYPEGNLDTGEFGLDVYQGDCLGKLLFEFATRDRQQLVAEIERLLVDVNEGRL